MSKNKNEKNFIGKLIFRKYKIIKQIGMGSFSFVFEGKNIIDNSHVAIKIEPRTENYHQLLEYESYVLASLQGFGIPKLISNGRSGNNNVLIFELLGKSLMQILRETQKCFTLNDICMMGIQMMDRMEFIHSKYFIHRDIKPDNFVIGLEDPSIIYLIDFGLSKKYRSSTTKKHVQFAVTKKLTGTLNFVSVNATRGLVQSRRDDLESIGYVLLFSLKGKLPWENINKLKNLSISKNVSLVYKIKKKIEPEKLCKNLPQELADYFRYCKNLKFEQNPDYEYLRGLFKNILKKNNCPVDYKFTWMKIYGKKEITNSKNKLIDNSRRENSHKRLFRIIKNRLQNYQKKCSNNNKNENDILNKNKENKNENLIKNENPCTNNDNTKEKEQKEINEEKEKETLFNSQKAMFNISIGSELDEKSINEEKILNCLEFNQKDIKDESVKKENENLKICISPILSSINRKVYNKINQKSNAKNYNNVNNFLSLTPVSNKSLKYNYSTVGYNIGNGKTDINCSNLNFNNKKANLKYTPVNREFSNFNEKNAIIRNRVINSDQKTKTFQNSSFNFIKSFNNKDEKINDIGDNVNYYTKKKDSNGVPYDCFNNYNNNFSNILKFNNNINNNKINNDKKNQAIVIRNKVYHKKYFSLNFSDKRKNNNAVKNISNITDNIYLDNSKYIHNSNGDIMNIRYPQPKNNILIMNNINSSQSESTLKNNRINNHFNNGMKKNTFDNEKAENSIICKNYSNKFNTVVFNG